MTVSYAPGPTGGKVHAPPCSLDSILKCGRCWSRQQKPMAYLAHSFWCRASPSTILVAGISWIVVRLDGAGHGCRCRKARTKSLKRLGCSRDERWRAGSSHDRVALGIMRAIISVTSRGAPGSSGVPMMRVGALICGRRWVVFRAHMAAAAAAKLRGAKLRIASSI